MTSIDTQPRSSFDMKKWVQPGLVAAAASMAAVLVVQFLALSIWPEAALFKPLDSYVRSALFTLIPAVGATILFGWLAARKPLPDASFIKISAAVLIISIIPDYLLPVPAKTFLASTVTASLHVVAALVIVPILVSAYRRQA